MTLIIPGHLGAVSFNDVGSPVTTTTSSLKVHIDAQVVRTEDLNWYYKLIQLCPDIQGELKSHIVCERFYDLPFMTRAAIWTTLGKVLIHVVDPRPYKFTIDSHLRTVLKRDDAPEYIRRKSSDGDLCAKNLQQLTQTLAAKLILSDSVAVKVHWAAHVFNPSLFCRPSEDFDLPELITPEDFNCNPKGIVKMVTEWSAKVSAAFHASMDVFDCYDSNSENCQLNSDREIIRNMLNPLKVVHAFDGGNKTQIRALERVRGKLIESICDPNNAFYRLPSFKTIEKYVDFNSKETFFGQAADLAAGIASELFQREGVGGLLSHFDYVTYNGKRAGRSDLARINDELERR